MQLANHPHRRYNPLTDQWVKVSPHRTKRPWQGQTEAGARPEIPAFDPSCYLCPGNSRAGGVKNPDYTETFAFDNDFASLLPDAPGGTQLKDGPNGLIRAAGERGKCRVICFSPKHNRTLAVMSREEILRVVRMWNNEYESLGDLDYISHVQIFENRGEAMGASNPHPHGQIWADEIIPDIPLTEYIQQEKYTLQHGSLMLLDYLEYERQADQRVVWENASWAVIVPFWAVWPFEVMILPKQRAACLSELTALQQQDLAEATGITCTRYDNLFLTSFPYSMGIHQAPTGTQQFQGVQMHLHFYPPLLRSASVKKFMVGYEMLAMAQRDITPEQSAQRLRDLSDIHYTQGGTHADH